MSNVMSYHVQPLFLPCPTSCPTPSNLLPYHAQPCVLPCPTLLQYPLHVHLVVLPRPTSRPTTSIFVLPMSNLLSYLILHMSNPLSYQVQHDPTDVRPYTLPSLSCCPIMSNLLSYHVLPKSKPMSCHVQPCPTHVLSLVLPCPTFCPTRQCQGGLCSCRLPTYSQQHSNNLAIQSLPSWTGRCGPQDSEPVGSPGGCAGQGWHRPQLRRPPATGPVPSC